MDYKKYYYSEVLLDFPPSGGICKVRTKRNMRPTECSIKWGYSDFYYINEESNEDWNISNLYSELDNLCDNLEKSKRNYNILIEDSSPYKGTIICLETLNSLKKEIYNSFDTATVVDNKTTEKIYWLSEFSLIDENTANITNYRHNYYNITNIHLILEGYSKPIPIIKKSQKDHITIVAKKGKPNNDIYYRGRDSINLINAYNSDFNPYEIRTAFQVYEREYVKNISIEGTKTEELIKLGYLFETYEDALKDLKMKIDLEFDRLEKHFIDQLDLLKSMEYQGILKPSKLLNLIKDNENNKN